MKYTNDNLKLVIFLLVYLIMYKSYKDAWSNVNTYLFCISSKEYRA